MRWLPLVLLLACKSELPEPSPMQPGPAPNPQGAPVAEGSAAGGTPTAAVNQGGASPTGAPEAGGQAPPPATTEGAEGAGGEGAAGTDPEVPGEVRPGVPVHVVLTSEGDAKTFDEAAFECCKKAEFTPVVQGYVALGQALAGGGDGATQATAMHAAIATAAGSADVDKPAKTELKKLDELLTAWEGAGAEQKTNALGDLSRVLVIFARARQGGGVKVAETYCSGSSTAWLQDSATIQNPYGNTDGKPCGTFR